MRKYWLNWSKETGKQIKTLFKSLHRVSPIHWFFSKAKTLVHMKYTDINFFSPKSGSLEIFNKWGKMRQRAVKVLFSPKLLDFCSVEMRVLCPLTFTNKLRLKYVPFLTNWDKYGIIHPQFFNHNKLSHLTPYYSDVSIRFL